MEKKRRFIINAVYFFIIGGSGYLAVRYLVPVLMPFLFAFLFATLVYSLGKKFPFKTKKGKKLGVIALTGLFYILIVGIVFVLGNGIMRLTEQAVLKLPQLYEQEFVPWIHSIARKLDGRYGGKNIVGFENVGSSFLELVKQLEQNLSQMGVDKMRDMSGYARLIPSFLIKIVITVVSTFFFASDYESISGFILGILPEKGRTMVLSVKKHASEVLTAYLKSYSLLMLLTFVELCIGLAILQIPYFLFVAMGIALFDILPVLGAGGVLIPWAAAAVVLGDYQLAVGLLILDLVITIIRNILEPRIVGKQIGLHPLATLVALFVGLKLAGFVGMIGFPVALSILVQLAKESGFLCRA